MSATETTYTTRLHEPYIHVKRPGRGKALTLDCWTACFRCVVEAS